MTKILVADDDPVTRKMLQCILEKNGYEVIAAEDGVQTWDILTNESDVRLAVVDWIMPGIDGVEICRKLQEEYKSGFIYVILLTAKEGTENLTLALEAGANDYITKPFKKDELLARLRAGERIIALQSQLAQSQKMESIVQLAAGIAHEINTPAQYVGDNARFIQESFNDIMNMLDKYAILLDANKKNTISSDLVTEIDGFIKDLDIAYLITELPKAIQQAIEGVEQISGIVRAMKEFAHPAVEGKANIDINRAIESTITVAGNRWKNVAEIETHYDTNLPSISGWPAELNQVILNLIVNAADAIGKVANDSSRSKSKGTITIETRRDKNWIEIRISDTGCGIPQNIQDKVFNPFFTTKDIGGGTGQGLSIAHAIVVKKHGGSITFETEIYKGTTFIVRLPIESVGDKTKTEMEISNE